MTSRATGADIRSHRPGGRGGRGRWWRPWRARTAWIGGPLLIAAALVAGLVAVANAHGDCTGPAQTFTVVAAPDIAAPLGTLARQWNAKRPAVLDTCVAASVVSRDSSQVAAALGTAWIPAHDGPAPHVWVPESSLWLSAAGARTEAAAVLPAERVSVAASPLVLAVRRPLAAALGWPRASLHWIDVLGAFASPDAWAKAGHPEWTVLKVGLTDPGVSAAGLAAVPALLDPGGTGTVSDQQLIASLGFAPVIGAMAAGTDTYFAAQGTAAQGTAAQGTAAQKGPNSVIAAFPALEVDLAAYNAGAGRAAPLVPIYDAPRPAVADFPYTILNASWVDGRARSAARLFQQYLLSPAARADLGGHGLRGPDGRILSTAALPPALGYLAQTAPPRASLDSARLSQMVAQWAQLLRPATLMVALDTSGSMATAVPGTTQTRLQLLQQTAIAGFNLMSNQVSLGLWAFSTERGTSRYRELVPFGPLAGPVGGTVRKQALVDAVGRLRASGGTPLYDTVYSAFHALQRVWRPGGTNAVLVVTDGANEVAGGLTLADLVSRLRREQQATRPVQVIAIAVGPEADVAALQQITGTTGGRTFIARDPRQAVQTLILAFAGRLG
jgi:Ca-activated chloride channel homolog